MVFIKSRRDGRPKAVAIAIRWGSVRTEDEPPAGFTELAPTVLRVRTASTHGLKDPPQQVYYIIPSLDRQFCMRPPARRPSPRRRGGIRVGVEEREEVAVGRVRLARASAHGVPQEGRGL